MVAYTHTMWFRRGPLPGVENADQPAWEESFAAEAVGYVDQLYSTALRLTRNRTQAEDLVQDTYLKAFRAARQFQPGTNLRAWLFTILQNTFRNGRRDAVRDPVAADSAQLESLARPAAAATPEAQLLGTVQDELVRAALDTLPPTFREAVLLRDIEECSYDEIARALDVPRGTVMSRISRGRRLLRARLAAASDAVPPAAEEETR